MNKRADHIQHNLSLLRLDPEDEVTCAMMYTLRNQYECIDLMRDFEKRLYQKMLDRYNDNCIDFNPEDYQYEIPTFDFAEVSTAAFQQMICQFVMPMFVVRGFVKNSDAVGKWTLDYFEKMYPDAEVACLIEHQDGSLEDFMGERLADVIAKMRPGNKEKHYVHNTSQIFKDCPELLTDIEYAKLKTYYSPVAVNAIVQLFMGGSDTGVRMHCANEFNSFLMIDGNKHWTFVPPEYTYALRPTLSSNGLNALCSIVDHQQSFDAFEKTNPLYNRLPKYSLLLEPGDMLVFSPWWWHAVSNTSPESIAVATRWSTIKAGNFPRGNITFGNIQKSNPYFNAYSKKYMASIINEEIIGDKDLLRDTFGRYHGDLYEGGE